MKPKIIISKFTKSAIFKPSFIGHMQSRVALVTKNEPKDQKYNLILAPVDEPAEKTPEPESLISKEEFDELVARIVKQIGIPSDDAVKQFWKWWTEDVQRYIDELKMNGGQHGLEETEEASTEASPLSEQKS